MPRHATDEQRRENRCIGRSTGAVVLSRALRQSSLPLLGLLAALCGCPGFDIDLSEEAAAAVREQDLGTLPYHPLVFHLDLSILAYQTYAQSLAWPFDPYYEDRARDGMDRDGFMDGVQGWAATRGTAELGAGLGVAALRGPGLLGGFEDNPLHDPIVYQYSRVHPWSDTITNADGEWTEYRMPREITGPIAEVTVCARTEGEPEGAVTVQTLVPGRDDANPDAADVLLAIDGGTGDKGEEGQPASRSLMAVALLRSTGGDDYEVHIAFRGSRSGSGLRSVTGAISTETAEGNPDWITDLGTRLIDAPGVSTQGQVFRGIGTSVQSVYPQLFACLAEVAGPRPPPTQVTLTGHSLGGGLAQHLASGLLQGDAFGPDGDAMPPELADWPWEQLKMISYGAPRVGDRDWAEPLTNDALDSQFWVNRAGSRWDAAAIGVTDLDVIPRLTDASRPAGYRVLVPTDPITTQLVPGGQHVGHTVYLSVPTAEDAGALPDFDDHEPLVEREMMVDALRDPRIPDAPWAYLAMDALNPDRDESERGTEAEYLKLADSVRAYYEDRGVWFDVAAFDATFTEFLELIP